MSNRSKASWVITFIMIFLTAIVIFPFIWILMTSFKKYVAIISTQFLFSPTLDNYIELFFTGEDFPRYLLNSLLVASSSTLIITGIGVMGAYSLSRTQIAMGLDRVILIWLLFLRMIFPVALAIPFYNVVRTLNLYDTPFALILPYTAINIPFAVWMLKGFFDDLPTTFEEAAFIDGCSVPGVFLKICLPLVRGGVAATAIFIFILCWNEYLFALIMTSTPNSMTLPVGVASLAQKFMIEWQKMSAATSIFAIPIFIFAFLVQKHLARGLTMGMGIKG